MQCRSDTQADSTTGRIAYLTAPPVSNAGVNRQNCHVVQSGLIGILDLGQIWIGFKIKKSESISSLTKLNINDI